MNSPADILAVLTDNLISSLATLLPLENLPYLRHLSLRGNPITEHEHYEAFTVWKVSSRFSFRSHGTAQS